MYCQIILYQQYIGVPVSLSPELLKESVSHLTLLVQSDRIMVMTYTIAEMAIVW